jgi:aryl-alcohol dehydrogenase-like predicted oxidoreductase
MARAFDMAVLAWAPLSGGELTGKYQRETNGPRRYGDSQVSERIALIVEELTKIASDLGRSPAQVALNRVRQQQHKGLIIPIIGARTAAQMQDNLACLEFTLTGEQLQRLDEVSAINLGFPHSFLRSQEVTELIFGNTLALIDNHRS